MRSAHNDQALTYYSSGLVHILRSSLVRVFETFVSSETLKVVPTLWVQHIAAESFLNSINNESLCERENTVCPNVNNISYEM